MRIDDEDLIGRKYPKWLGIIPYGDSYRDRMRRQTIMHPFPLNLFVSYCRSAWFTIMIAQSALDKLETKAYRAGIEEGQKHNEGWIKHLQERQGITINAKGFV